MVNSAGSRTRDIATSYGHAVADLKFEDLSPLAAENARRGVFDTIGVSLAATGAAKTELEPIVKLTRSLSGSGAVPAFAYGWNLPMFDAALWMGSLVHALDYDDIHDIAVVHPSGPILSALTPLILSGHDASGRQLLTAVAAGQDIAIRLGASLRRSITEYGWLPSTPSAIAAAVACAKLLNLPGGSVRDAIALAVHQTSGTMQSAAGMGSVFRAIRDGFNARAGLTAAMLAQSGCAGDLNILEGEFGYFRQFFGDDYDKDVLVAGIGERWLGEEMGLKAWPCCGYSQFFITAIDEILSQDDGHKPEDVEQVEVVGKSGLLRAQCEPREERIRPTRGIDAKFSLPFQVGKFLANQSIRLRDFTPAGMADEHAHEFAARVGWRDDPTIQSERDGFGPGIVEVEFTDGGRASVRVDHALGSADNPLSWEAVVAKFADCLEAADVDFDDDDAARFAAEARTLEDADSVTPFLRYFC